MTLFGGFILGKKKKKTEVIIGHVFGHTFSKAYLFFFVIIVYKVNRFYNIFISISNSISKIFFKEDFEAIFLLRIFITGIILLTNKTIIILI